MDQKEVLFRRKVVHLRLNENMRPSWISPGEKIPVFLDEAYCLAPEARALATFEYNGVECAACIKRPEGIEFAFDVDKAISDIADEAYLTKQRPLTSRLWFNYRSIPPGLRVMAARGLSFHKRSDPGKMGFPGWPVDKSIEVLNYLKEVTQGSDEKSLWPEGKKFAFCVTHDLESRHGLKDIERLVNIDRSFGFKACWNVSTMLIESHGKCIERLRASGCEIGCHGYNHDNKFAFLKKEKMRVRLERCAKYIEQYEMKGFRSPSLLRSPELMEELSGYFKFDSSYPDTDAFSETGERNGCSRIRPFFINRILELPITMPMDSSMLFMGYDHEKMLQVWLKKLDWLRERQGMALINVHCHRPFSLKGKVYDAYERLLGVVAKDRNCWRASAGDITKFIVENKT